MRKNEQKLIDLIFELALFASTNKWFRNKSDEEIAEWIRLTLKKSGFKTNPCGASCWIINKGEIMYKQETPTIKRAMINIIKALIKLPFFSLYLLFLPLVMLSELEDLGSGKGWGNRGFFYKLANKLDKFINKIWRW